MSSAYPSEQPEPQIFPFSSASFLPRLVVGVILLNLFVIALVGLSIQQSSHQYQERGEITSQNLAQTLEREIAGVIETDDLALFAVIDEYKRQRAAGGVDGKALNAYIDRVRSRLPEIDGLRISDAQGVLVYGNDVMPGVKASVADRRHFMRQRDDPQAGLVISRPQMSRANQKWVIALTRRIDQPDGSFGGVAIAAITLEHFYNAFSTLNVGPRGAISLRDGELGRIVRYPALPGIGGAIGSKPSTPIFREMVAAGKTSGTFTAHAGSDKVERAYTYRKIGGLPLYIVVGLDTRESFAEWRNEAATQVALATLFALMTILLACLIYRIWKRQLNSVEALARQEAKFHTVADFTFDWEYWQGPQGGILYMTPSCERVTGYTQAEFDADPGLLLRIIHPEDRHLMDQHLHNIAHPVANQNAAPLDFRILRRDGRICWIAHRCRAIFGKNGEYMGRRVGNRDINERKQAESIAQRERIRLQTILKTASDGIHLMNGDGVLVEANEAFLNMLGYDASVIGKLRVSDWSQTPWEDSKARIDDLIARHGNSMFEARHRRRDGVVLDVEINASMIEIEGKGYIYAASRDITERKRVEEELQHHRLYLEELVAERTTQLRSLTTELTMVEERERHAIAQDLHDDLGQVLAIAKLKLNMLKLQGMVESDADSVRLVSEIEDMVDRANHSVRSLSMQLSPPVLSQFGLLAALEWLAEEMQCAYDLNVHVYNDGKPPLLDAVLSSALFRTVRELLINVSKHAQVDAAEVSVLTDEDKLVITVADAGIGFGVTQRLMPSTEGGYGLFSVRERLNAIGGEMQIDSQPGDGTLVVLILPRAAMKRPPAK